MHSHSPDSITDLKPGDYLCCLYETEQEHRAVVTSFVRHGLQQGEKVLYIADTGTAETASRYLRDDGLDVAAHLDRGQPTVLTPAEIWAQGDEFDPEATIARLQAETERALAEGYSALRVAAELTRALQTLSGREQLIEYEARLNEFFSGNQSLALCLCDHRRSDPATLLDVLRTHPTIAIGPDIYDNVYYIPPGEPMGEDRPGVTLGHWLESLREQKRTHEALEQYIRRLENLRRTDRAILEAQSPQAVAQIALAHLRQLVPCQRASITLFEFDTNQATVLAAHTEVDTSISAEARFPLNDFGGDLEALRRGEVCVLEDVPDLPQRSPVVQALHAEGMYSFANVPLVVEGRLIGSLNLGARRPAAFTEEQIEIAREVANSLAVAIQQARLHESQRQRTADLRRSNTLITALGEVAARLQINLDTDQLVGTVEARLRELDINWMVALLDPTGQTLAVRYSSLTPQAIAQIEERTGLTWRDFRIPRDRFPHATDIIEQRRTLFTADQDPVATVSAMMPHVPRPVVKLVLELTDAAAGQPAIYVPLVTEGRVTGIMWVWGPDLREVDAPLFSVFASQVTTAIENAELFEQVRASRQRLQALSQRLVDMQEAERQRIAHELHNEVGQVLTGLKITLEAIERRSADTVQPHVRQAQTLVRDLIAQVRSLSLKLHPPMLDNMGLLPTLLWHFRRFTDQTSVNVSFEHSGVEERRFPSEVETAAYRIAQEALTNVARHAGVDEVTVQVHANEDVLVVQVEDEGAGFDPEATAAAGDSFGLTGMDERATWLGGRLTVESAAGAGTRVRAELPLESRLERREETR